ncbi:IMP cyclohydrolase and phosphoribosylaminoimidazolecarboxamide formyltransferase [Erysipelotrichaceae bacterium]|nr:IMP cyclohydrolase and phosphoribosylaminoimidazolecarboxamide formyltransferase [Erysipelotrichaceae bacterium]
MKKRVLMSVSDKTGIIEFAKQLVALDYEIISTGGTYATLVAAAIPVMGIEDLTDFPEILDGRVKTLHPSVHAGLLAVRDNPAHIHAMRKQKLNYIDIVVVNLYPFKKTIAKSDVTYEEAIENIDIGGPSMLRSAAKNHRFITVLTDREDYEIVLAQLQEYGETTLDLRKTLARKVFQKTAAYDALIADFFAKQQQIKFPDQLTLTFEKQQNLRYGENPQQQAAFYRTPLACKNALAFAKQLHGKELSYNNIQDGEAAIRVMLEFTKPTVIALKHMNPCGVGIGNTLEQAWDKAYAADPISIFGGIIATNQIVDALSAQKMKAIFLELIIAPGFTKEALAILAEKKNLRLLELPISDTEDRDDYQVVTVVGGALIQTPNEGKITADDLEVVTKKVPTAEELIDLLFAWNIVKHVKSNAIVLAKSGQTIGIGAGQMNRVGAAKIAIEQARSKSAGSVMSSDAFLPMADTVKLAADAGIIAIIQPGGSIKDEESIAAADAHGIAMVFTKMRNFKH